MQLQSSLICVDKSGRVGIIADMAPGAAKFAVFDKDGNTAAPVDVPYEDLVQAKQDQIPASRRLPDAQAIELGYLSAPVAPAKAGAQPAPKSDQ